MSSRFSRRPSSQAISSSSTISQAIKSLACAKQLRPVVRASFICRPTAPISIRSSKPSPSLRHYCERSPPGPSPRSGMPSATCSIASPHRNAPTISPTLDMFHSIGIGSKRSAALPDVPTVAEAGLAGFESSGWQGWFVPANTPRDIVNTVHQGAKTALAAPDVLERLRITGNEAVGSTPAEFEQRFKADLAKFAKIVKEAHIPAQD